jgi:hypothetical protein
MEAASSAVHQKEVPRTDMFQLVAEDSRIGPTPTSVDETLAVFFLGGIALANTRDSQNFVVVQNHFSFFFYSAQYSLVTMQIRPGHCSLAMHSETELAYSLSSACFVLSEAPVATMTGHSHLLLETFLRLGLCLWEVETAIYPAQHEMLCILRMLEVASSLEAVTVLRLGLQQTYG